MNPILGARGEHKFPYLWLPAVNTRRELVSLSGRFEGIVILTRSGAEGGHIIHDPAVSANHPITGLLVEADIRRYW